MRLTLSHQAVPALLIALAAALPLSAQWRLMPLPASIQAAEGQLAIRQDFRVSLEGYTEPRLERAATRLTTRIAGLTGMPIPLPGVNAPAALIVRTTAAAKPVQQLGEDESYQLAVDSKQAVITAPNPLGAMHGMETFYQLIDNGETGWVAPAVRIDDKPRFPWRGLLLDVSRHFQPLAVIRRNLDGMAAVKLNVLHWHLSDDQGFRVESKSAPNLTEAGSDGLFYTQEEVRGIIEYARDRGIRVVPEFDIPGHTQSWLAAYPELAAAPGPVSILRKWGIAEAVMDPTRPEVYELLEHVLAELAALFPDEYFHIGGDEVDPKQWNASGRIKDYMKTNGIKDAAALQARFNQRIEAVLSKAGKHAEGWDEVLHPDLPRSVVVQSWRGAKSLAEAARQGFSVLLSSGYYLDHMEPASKLYLVDPWDGDAAALTPEQRDRILGGEVCMWGEYISSENVDSRIWPRTAAVAERFWSPWEIRDVAGMYKRLEAVDAELTRLGLTHNTSPRAMLARLTGLNDIDPLKTLADVIEPGSLSLRHHVNPNYTQSTPLNRFADAVIPDSDTARHFGELVDRYLARHSDTDARDGLRAWMNLWIVNDPKVAESVGKREVAQDAVAASAILARVAAEGLVALAALEAEKRLSYDSLVEAREGEKPVGEVTIAIAPHVTRLVAAVTPKNPPPKPPVSATPPAAPAPPVPAPPTRP